MNFEGDKAKIPQNHDADLCLWVGNVLKAVGGVMTNATRLNEKTPRTKLSGGSVGSAGHRV